MDASFLILEFIVLVIVVISFGPILQAWLNAWGLLLFLGVVVLGMLLPLMLYWRRDWFAGCSATTAAALVLLGGFVLRLVIVFAAEGV